jgi:hypothetical protein
MQSKNLEQRFGRCRELDENPKRAVIRCIVYFGFCCICPCALLKIFTNPPLIIQVLLLAAPFFYGCWRWNRFTQDGIVSPIELNLGKFLSIFDYSEPQARKLIRFWIKPKKQELLSQSLPELLKKLPPTRDFEKDRYALFWIRLFLVASMAIFSLVGYNVYSQKGYYIRVIFYPMLWTFIGIPLFWDMAIRAKKSAEEVKLSKQIELEFSSFIRQEFPDGIVSGRRETPQFGDIDDCLILSNKAFIFSIKSLRISLPTKIAYDLDKGQLFKRRRIKGKWKNAGNFPGNLLGEIKGLETWIKSYLTKTPTIFLVLVFVPVGDNPLTIKFEPSISETCDGFEIMRTQGVYLATRDSSTALVKHLAAKEVIGDETQ